MKTPINNIKTNLRTEDRNKSFTKQMRQALADQPTLQTKRTKNDSETNMARAEERCSQVIDSCRYYPHADAGPSR